MKSASFAAGSQTMTVRPHLGIGWETTIDRISQEIVMQPKAFGLKLPPKRRIPFSRVARVATASRVSWWSWAGMGFGGWAGVLLFGAGSAKKRFPMPDKGWRWDILMTLQNGKTIRVEVIKTPAEAAEIESQMRQMLGLPDTF